MRAKGMSGAKALLTALCLLAMSAAPGRSWAADKCKISSAELPVTMVGSRAVAKVGINGTEIKLIVDSGAFYSFLTDATAQQLQLKVGSLPWGMRIQGVTGDVEAGLTTVKRLQLLGAQIPDVEFVVGGNEESNGTMGMIGRNLLTVADVEFDLAHGMIRLMFPSGDCGDSSMAYWAEGMPVSQITLLRDEHGSKLPPIQAIAQVNGTKVRVLFDTGAQSLLSLAAAKRAGIKEADMKRAGKIYGAGRGDADAWTTPINSFEIGSEAISNIQMRVGDFELSNTEMLLGIDFFLSHRIYVSKKQRRMYFTYNGGTVFALSALEAAKAAKASAPANAASAPDDTATATASAAAADADGPTDAAGYARRGAASAARLDYVRALADLDRACQMDPQVADYFVRRATVHLAMRQGRLALKDYDAALALDPAQAEARLWRAWWRGNNGDREGALEDLQTLDKTLPSQAHQRLQIASLYQKLELPQRALAQWSLWIPAHPNDIELADVLNSRCWVRTLLGTEFDQALDDCDKAIDLQSKNGYYYDSRAWLRLRRGELRKALNDFDRALKLRPDGAWSLYGRGIVRRKLGESEAGQADIDAARKLDPSIDKQAGRHGLAADPQPAAQVTEPASG